MKRKKIFGKLTPLDGGALPDGFADKARTRKRSEKKKTAFPEIPEVSAHALMFGKYPEDAFEAVAEFEREHPAGPEYLSVLQKLVRLGGDVKAGGDVPPELKLRYMRMLCSIAAAQTGDWARADSKAARVCMALIREVTGGER